MLGLQVNTMVTNLSTASTAMSRGDGWRAAELFAQSATQVPGMLNSLRQVRNLALAASGLGPQRLGDFLTNCFGAGTPIQGEFGARPIESFRPGDRVWARDECDPDAPAQLRPIEECFVSEAALWHVHVGGQVIRTTDEHPFWVLGKGWVGARHLQAGDLLVGRDGDKTPVEEVYETGEIECVHNFRVGEHHTYFVGGADWGFNVWAHNVCVIPRSNLRGTWNQRTRGISRATVFGTAQSTGATPHARLVQRQMYRVVGNERFQVGTTGPSYTFQMNGQSYVTLNRNLRMALGRRLPQKVFDPPANLRPDAIVVENINGQFRVSMIEVRSPGQTITELETRMQMAWDSIKRQLGGNVTGGARIVVDENNVTRSVVALV
jgi:hypothetical protein